MVRPPQVRPVSASDYSLIRDLFHELAELEPSERTRILNDRKVSDEVRREVESLLEHTDEPSEKFGEEELGNVGRALIDDSSRETLAPDPDPAAETNRIGDYDLLRKLGGGGMGVVYAARRDGTDYDVALKVLLPTFGSEDISRRFRREAELLERLRHPGIAAFLEWGETTSGSGGQASQSYLAMELVDGPPLTAFADDAALDFRARIALVAEVCDAIQHAHELGIVHRDLKPANVLVDPNGRPKVLDFGIARVVDAELHSLTETGSASLFGTLPYMSPEQVSGGEQDVDARADVYALGVLAFELLTGRLPFELSGLALYAAIDRIRNGEAERLGRLEPSLAGDLELVVAKALEKEAERRYASAAALAADLRAYLDGRPVEARPLSTARRLRVATRRHPVATAILATGLFGILGTTFLWQRALVDGERARVRMREATESQALTEE